MIVEDIAQLARLFAKGPERALKEESPTDLVNSFQWCRRHGLGPWFLSFLPSQQWAPEALRPNVGEFYAKLWLQTQRRLAEMKRVFTAFQAEGLDCLVFKGALWSRQFHRTLQARRPGDLDLLVRKQDFRAAMTLLQGLGYTQSGHLIAGLPAFCFFEHGLDFVGERVAVDLHHNVAVHPTLKLDSEALFESRVEVEINGTVYATLSPVRCLQANLLGMIRDAGLSKLRLKQVVDTWAMLDLPSQRLDELLSLADSDGSLKPCCKALSVCLGLLYDQSLPERFDILPYRMGRIEATEFLRKERWLQNKWWSWCAMEGPVWQSAAFWLTGLPVRLAAFR